MKTQTDRLLEMLMQGPVSNVQMAQACILNYTARISDLRKTGHDIRELPHGHEGTRWYEWVNKTVSKPTPRTAQAEMFGRTPWNPVAVNKS